MKLLLRLLFGVLGLIVLLVVVAFFLPREYRVERSIMIAAPAETVFPLVADLRAWGSWGVWYARDPAMVVTFSETEPNAVGGWTAWHSATQGNGRATLTQVEPYSEVNYTLEFSDMDMHSQGEFRLSPVEGGVEVTWADGGDLGYNPVWRWFGLALDGMLGGAFEEGLAKLKLVAEAPLAEATP